MNSCPARPARASTQGWRLTGTTPAGRSAGAASTDQAHRMHQPVPVDAKAPAERFGGEHPGITGVPRPRPDAGRGQPAEVIRQAGDPPLRLQPPSVVMVIAHPDLLA